MQYVAAVSGKGKQVDKVKEQLLQCNPILEGKFQLTCIDMYIDYTMIMTTVLMCQHFNQKSHSVIFSSSYFRPPPCS